MDDEDEDVGYCVICLVEVPLDVFIERRGCCEIHVPEQERQY